MKSAPLTKIKKSRSWSWKNAAEIFENEYLNLKKMIAFILKVLPTPQKRHRDSDL